MYYEKEINGLVNFIRTEVTNAGKTGCVVGVSGGVDSAVIACLCKLAFPDTTYGISMPEYKNAHGDSTKRAKELCKKFSIPLRCSIVGLSPADETIYELMVENLTNKKTIMSKKAKGNHIARQRMVTLYTFAEMLDCLVIGTDNLSENYIGYFTKFADGGVDINPIGQYFKSEVFKLAKYLGVVDSILNTKPSAELWEGQTDEDELGFTYDELESAIKILTGSINLEWVGNSSVAPEINYPVVWKVREMHSQTKHKRILPKEYIRR